MYVKYVLPVGQSLHRNRKNIFQRVVQYSQDLEGEDLHYHVRFLYKSSTEDDTKKSYLKLSLRSHPKKNKHTQASTVMRMINVAKEGLEDLLRYNDTMRE